MAWIATVNSILKELDYLRVFVDYSNGAGAVVNKEHRIESVDGIPTLAMEVSRQLARLESVDVVAVRAEVQPGFSVTPADVALTPKQIAWNNYGAAMATLMDAKRLVDLTVFTVVEADVAGKIAAVRSAYLVWLGL